MSNVQKVSLKQLKFDPIYKEYDGGVVVFNLNESKRKQIMELCFTQGNIDESKLELQGETLLLDVLPIVTNIDLNGLDDDVIKEIMNEPSDILIDVVSDVESLLLKFFNQVNKNAQKINLMDDNIKKEFLDRVAKNTDSN